MTLCPWSRIVARQRRDQVSKEWAGATAPTLADFEALAAEAWEKLPAEFRAMAGDLLIRVDDFATD